jgi:hypothetical protein
MLQPYAPKLQPSVSRDVSPRAPGLERCEVGSRVCHVELSALQQPRLDRLARGPQGREQLAPLDAVDRHLPSELVQPSCEDGVQRAVLAVEIGRWGAVEQLQQV